MIAVDKNTGPGKGVLDQWDLENKRRGIEFSRAIAPEPGSTGKDKGDRVGK